MLDTERLLSEAVEARKNAYMPYSNFAVGAAILTENGKIFRGCNVENASSSVTTCAERTALVKAVSEGFKDFKAIAIVADSEDVCRPCGSCRQALVEFNPEMEVIMGNTSGKKENKKAKQLLPDHFKREGSCRC